jgi:hypothetical protein
MASENAERCVAAGLGLQLRREGRGRRRATRARRLGVLRCLDVPPVTSTELRQRRTRGSRSPRWPLTARMMGHGWAWQRNTTQGVMDSEEQRSALRAAVYGGDGPAVVDLLGGVGADDDSL